MKKNKKLLLNTLLPIITPIPALVGSFYLMSGNFNFNKLNSELEFKNSKPSSFAKFSHSSSFEDLKLKVNIDNKEYSIKGGVNHKYLLRALVGAASEDPNILVVSDSSTYDKYKPVKYDDVPRTKTFSVLHGIGTAFTPVLDDKGNQAYSEDGKKLMKKNKTSDKNYIDDVDDMFDAIFEIGDRKDFASFGGVIKNNAKRNARKNKRTIF